MNVKQLKKELEKIDDSRIVIMQKDSEGNEYSPLSGVDDNALYKADCTWSGEVGSETITPEMKKAGYTDEDKGAGKKAVVLFPIN